MLVLALITILIKKFEQALRQLAIRCADYGKLYKHGNWFVVFRQGPIASVVIP
jgi:hypothetical protein